MLEPLGGGAAVALTLPLGVDSARGCHLTLSADGRWLAIGTRYGDIYLWDLTAPGAARMLVGHTPNGGDGYLAGVNALAFSPSTSLLASAGADGTLALSRGTRPWPSSCAALTPAWAK